MFVTIKFVTKMKALSFNFNTLKPTLRFTVICCINLKSLSINQDQFPAPAN